MKQRLEGDLTRSGDQQQSDQPAISEAQRRKEREMVAREVSGCGHAGGVSVC